VTALVEQARRGPPGAAVSGIEQIIATGEMPSGFRILPTL
jgi:hypothetical protein